MLLFILLPTVLFFVLFVCMSFVFNYFTFIKLLCCKFLGLPSALAKFFCQASVDHFCLEKKSLIKKMFVYVCQALRYKCFWPQWSNVAKLSCIILL